MNPADTTTTTEGALCEACGEQGEPGDRFCEGCGAALPATEGPPPAEREGTRARPVTARTAAPGADTDAVDGHAAGSDGANGSNGVVEANGVIEADGAGPDEIGRAHV